MKNNFKICYNIWVEVDGEVALSQWRLSLLEAVEETGSISAAAEKVGVSYHRAWEKIHDCEVRLGVKLLETKTGGHGGGGAVLSQAAKDYILRFKAMLQGIETVIQEHYYQEFKP